MNNANKTAIPRRTLFCVHIAASSFLLCRAAAVADCTFAATDVGGDIPLRLPFRPGEHYPVTQGFCQAGGDHSGYQVDFGIPVRTPIVACSAGTVVLLGTYSSNCTDVATPCGLLEQGGLFVRLKHPSSESGQAWYSSYLHLSVQTVTNGQYVEAGQTIGLSGNTGLSTGPHLHFHIRKGPADNPLNNPANHVGVRSTPIAGLDMGTGASPILTFSNGVSYRAVEVPDVVTGLMSPIVSYQYPNDLGSEALTNGGIGSPIVSYQYFEWPGDDVLQLQSSPRVSYYYQFLDAPPLIILPTSRLATVAETTPATLFSPPSQSQLKIFEGGLFTATPAFPLDANRITIVLTHGWNSNPHEWVKNMAALILVNVTPAPNIVAWDWTEAASSSLCDPGLPAARTPDQGRAFGQALLTALGPNYSSPVHFVGHSFGTLVNAFAADYLHETSAKSAGAFLPANTHMTLFDEAEVGTQKECFSVNVAKDARLYWEILFGNPLSPKPYFNHPLPKQSAWADNYVAAFGLLHSEAVNVILTNDFPASASDFASWGNALVQFHAYPYQWYEETISTDISAMGHRWSFERVGFAGAPAVSTVFIQADSGLEWNLTQMTLADGTSFLNQRIQKYRGAIFSTAGQIVNDTMTAHGQITGEMLLVGPPPDAGAAIINWVVNLFTSGGGGGSFAPMRGPRPQGAGGESETNFPALAWIPLSIPSNAVSMTFDFQIQGDWKDDSLAAALNGTNMLSLSATFFETNVLINSGPIQVSAFAGRTNEFFVGIVGGTSTNAQLTVQDIQFFSLDLPSLQVQSSSRNHLLSWPLSAQDFGLQSTTNLAESNSWTTITNVPSIVDLQNTVTNPISGGAGFYRLKK